MERKEFRDLASPAAARETIRSLELDAGTETVPLASAAGRTLAERIDAPLDVPGFDRSSLDGYALRAADTFGADEADPARLALVGTVHAGEEPDVAVGAGEAVEISTGAVLPDGADAMVPVEQTDLEATGEGQNEASEDGPEAVLVRTAVAPGENVLFAGADVAAGERALGPGTPLTARDVGLLSALGIDAVPVRVRPRVGIISTGDELVPPGEPLDSARGEIYDVNGHAIAAAVEEAGGDPVRYPRVGDDRAAMARILREAAAECDLVCTSGSTSASAVDVVHRVIEERGELLLHGVSVKPGKPMLVGRIDGTAYVGLPGYPVSAMMVFRTFLAPALREAAGVPEPTTATVSGRLAVGERSPEGRHRLVPVGVTDERQQADGGRDRLVYPVDKGSGATTSLARADGVVEVPATTDYLETGERVAVTLFSADVRPPTLFAVGEDDPTMNRVLDELVNPRYLAIGSRPAARQLRDGVPDVAVVAGALDRELEAVELGRWEREWGLLVPAGNPEGVAGVPDLLDRDLRVANRSRDSGLRQAFERVLADIADERGASRPDLEAAIAGFEVGLRAHESPARRVLEGAADAGVGLGETADRLDLGFVSLGQQSVRVLGNPDRLETAGVRELTEHLGERDDVDST